MADRPSWISDIDSPLRMAARVPQHFGGSDGAVSGFAVEGAGLPQGVALPPGYELNHPPYPAWTLLRKAPVGSGGVRSGESPSGSEGSGPVPDWAVDQVPRLLSKINVQPAKTQPPLSRYGVGGEGPDPYQYGSGDGSVSDMSVSGASEKYGETFFRGCSSANSSLGEHPGPRLKLMCSFGGKILPRPGDGKLRYAGGETRIVSVRRHISYADLMRKMTQFYGHAVSMKYQLPDEDLDALISVSSDEDLQNMMEEYDRLEAGEGNPRVRIFISSPSEFDVAHRSDSAERRSIDLLYVDAINGLSESLSGKQLDIPSPSASNNLIGFEGSDNWNAPRIPESVPVSLLASPVFEGTAAPSIMQSMPVGITSNNKPPVLSRILSAPTSASSTPPVFPQASQVRQFPIPDSPLRVSPDQPIKAPVGHLFEMHRGDGTYHEVEGVGSATSSVNSQHDSSYEPRRGIDSPTKAQQETMLPYGYNLDQFYRPEQLRMADIGVSRVDSQSTLPHSDSYGQGKLMPPATFLAGENHMPNIMRLPLDRQTFGAQPQLQAAQTAVQPSLEFRHEGYQWMDPMQQSAAESMQAQQQALLHSQFYHPAGMDLTQHSAPERMQRQVQPPHYRQEFVPQFYAPTGIGLPQQSALESIPQQQAAHHRQQIFSQLHAPVGTSGQEMAAFKQADQSLQQEDALTGQLPFKSIALQTTLIPPGMGEVPVTLTHLASAPPPPSVAFGGLQYLPVPGGLVDLPYGKATVQPNNEHANKVLKPSNIPSNIPLDSSREQLYMESQIAREQARTPLVNLEKVSQENKGDSLQRKQDVQQSQSYYSDELPRPVIPMLRRENKEHLQQHEDEEFAVRPRYQDGVDWSMQKTFNDSEETMGGWTQMGQVDRKKELAPDFTSSEIFGKLPANAPGMHILEPPFVAAVASDTHSAVENTGKQFDPLGSTPAHLRAGLVPSVVSGHPLTLASTSFSESSQQPYMPARFEGDGLPMLPITQAEALQGNPVSLATQRMSDDMAAGIVPSVHTGSLLVPSPPNMVRSASKDERLSKMEEGQGNDSGGHSSEDAFETTAKTLDGGPNRPASGNMISNPEDLLGVSVVSKKGSNKSSTDEGSFVPPFSHVQTMVPNGTSYHPIGLSPWGMGLDAFQTNVILSPATCASAASGLSTTNPSFPVIIDAVTASSILAPAGKDSSYGKTTVSRPREELVEGAHTRADLAFLDNTRPISAPFVIPFDSGQVSEGLQEKGLFPPFSSDTMREPETAEREEEDIKGDLEHVANDVAAAVLQPALTLSMQNWDDTLANVEGEEEITKESLSIYSSLDEVKSHAGKKEVTFQEMKVCEADTDGLVTDKPANVAVIAEEDAISHGLQTIKNSDLEELRELGSGTFGTVYHGKWRGTDVAIKRIKSSCFIGRPSERERLIADFWREAYILGQLHHPNVVAFYGVVRDGPGGTLATVTEYMVNGSLKQVMQRKDRTIDRRKRLLIIMDAAFGMEYLHGKNIVHFDLKCENLLVNMRDPQRPICKVGDLGLSKVKQQTMVSGGVRGTLPWMAPELLNGSSSLVSEKVDVFSFGIVMWELVTGEEPYANMHYGAIIGGIVSNTLRPPVPSFCDPSWKSLMERCWSAEPGERPSFTEIASELRAMATSASSKVQVQAPTAASG